MATLKIKVNGVWEDIPAIQGVDGKSAYQSALDSGYVGTEVEFNADLSLVSEKMNLDGSNSLVENLTFVGNGVLSYDGDRQILQYTNTDGTTNDVGAELWFSEGKASGAIANGAPVQFAGVQGDHYLFKTAVPSEINANPSLFMGIATSDIANNAWGKVTNFGIVHDINTGSYTAGTILWFDSVNGGLTSTKPSYPNAQIQVCAVVVQNSTVGSIIVRPTVYQDAYTRSETDTLLDAKAPLASPTFTGTVSGITKAMVGLGNVTNESKATMFTSPTFTGTVSGITKAMVGLGNVDNTSDANKPISIATQNELNERLKSKGYSIVITIAPNAWNSIVHNFNTYSQTIFAINGDGSANGFTITMVQYIDTNTFRFYASGGVAGAGRVNFVIFY